MVAITKARVDDQDEFRFLDIAVDVDRLRAALLGDSEIFGHAPTPDGVLVLLLFLLRFSVQWEQAQSGVVVADLCCFTKRLGILGLLVLLQTLRVLWLRFLSFPRIRPPLCPNVEICRPHGFHEFCEEPGTAGKFSRADFRFVGLPFVSGPATTPDFCLACDHPVRNTVT
ncbi:hypothetical protein SVTN_33915 [Streptomyces vietnamensis]|uniref:Uncharacterized protein n=1 Tax=Streptomyces vietnamensis TaxID=362257 RepID=A0A0B5I7N8_9ACTN|nr:hypothetical protein SVTN_33915 [Streptomyces vietnamensis]